MTAKEREREIHSLTCALVRGRVWAENTHLLHKGKYHCTAALLFDRFGSDQTCKSLSNSTQAKQPNPNRSNRKSAVQ